MCFLSNGVDPTLMLLPPPASGTANAVRFAWRRLMGNLTGRTRRSGPMSSPTHNRGPRSAYRAHTRPPLSSAVLRGPPPSRYKMPPSASALGSPAASPTGSPMAFQNRHLKAGADDKVRPPGNASPPKGLPARGVRKQGSRFFQGRVALQSVDMSALMPKRLYSTAPSSSALPGPQQPSPPVSRGPNLFVRLCALSVA